jgi:hypothetical protein
LQMGWQCARHGEEAPRETVGQHLVTRWELHRWGAMFREMHVEQQRGVPPSDRGSTQIGNLTVCSTRPPAPSGVFCTRSSTRSGSSASRLMGTIGIVSSGAEVSAGATLAP